jgi:hypothetical protein
MVELKGLLQLAADQSANARLASRFAGSVVAFSGANVYPLEMKML